MLQTIGKYTENQTSQPKRNKVILAKIKTKKKTLNEEECQTQNKKHGQKDS